ncbi:MAG: RNA 3'-terminal phosphate cyclase [Pirellulales bacterium]
MLTIDGSMGEGGGQILRSSLALSVITGTPITIENIRAKRDKPGLRRQHLTAVLAAAETCGATVDGAHVGSSNLTFAPGKLQPGNYHFDIGTAGSTTLVTQTVLPPLMLADTPSRLLLKGGTHNVHAPPFDYLERVFVPLINRMGPRVHVQLERYGFFPAGGGRFSVQIKPVQILRPLALLERGATVRREARALVAGLAASIADRELVVIKNRLNWNDDELIARDLGHGYGPGNVVLLEIESEQITEVFTGFGQRGVPAEAVAAAAAEEASQYEAAGAPVGTHLADQLILPLALAGGGSFVTMPLTLHTTTNIDVVQMFLPVNIRVTELTAGTVRVDVAKDY